MLENLKNEELMYQDWERFEKNFNRFFTGAFIVGTLFYLTIAAAIIAACIHFF